MALVPRIIKLVRSGTERVLRNEKMDSGGVDVVRNLVDMDMVAVVGFRGIIEAYGLPICVGNFHVPFNTEATVTIFSTEVAAVSVRERGIGEHLPIQCCIVITSSRCTVGVEVLIGRAEKVAGTVGSSRGRR